jgi:hypothetical protein
MGSSRVADHAKQRCELARARAEERGGAHPQWRGWVGEAQGEARHGGVAPVVRDHVGQARDGAGLGGAHGAAAGDGLPGRGAGVVGEGAHLGVALPEIHHLVARLRHVGARHVVGGGQPGVGVRGAGPPARGGRAAAGRGRGGRGVGALAARALARAAALAGGRPPRGAPAGAAAGAGAVPAGPLVLAVRLVLQRGVRVVVLVLFLVAVPLAGQLVDQKVVLVLGPQAAAVVGALHALPPPPLLRQVPLVLLQPPRRALLPLAALLLARLRARGRRLPVPDAARLARRRRPPGQALTVPRARRRRGRRAPLLPAARALLALSLPGGAGGGLAARARALPLRRLLRRQLRRELPQVRVQHLPRRLAPLSAPAHRHPLLQQRVVLLQPRLRAAHRVRGRRVAAAGVGHAPHRGGEHGGGVGVRGLHALRLPGRLARGRGQQAAGAPGLLEGHRVGRARDVHHVLAPRERVRGRLGGGHARVAARVQHQGVVVGGQELVVGGAVGERAAGAQPAGAAGAGWASVRAQKAKKKKKKVKRGLRVQREAQRSQRVVATAGTHHARLAAHP